MDDLIARIIARLERNAADATHDANEKDMPTQSVAYSVLVGQASAYGNAAAIVREAWDDEQAKIAEEERADYVPTKAEERHSEDPDMYPDPWAEVRDLPPTVAWHEEGR